MITSHHSEGSTVYSADMRSQGDDESGSGTTDTSSDDRSAIPRPRSASGNSGTTDDQSPDPHAQDTNEYRSARHSLIIGLVGALVGGLLSYAGAWHQAQSLMEVQTSQNQA